MIHDELDFVIVVLSLIVFTGAVIVAATMPL